MSDVKAKSVPSSGVAALMLQANSQLSAEQTKMQMLAGAINLGALPNEQGMGEGDAYRAYLKAIGEEVPNPPPPPTPTPTPTEPPGCLAGLLGQRK